MKKFLKNNWILLVALIYIVMPIDIIPDTLAPIGTSDDFLIVLTEFIRRVITQTKDEKKGLKNNWFLLLVLLYVLSPFDLDFIPGIGTIDDAGLVAVEVFRNALNQKKLKLKSKKNKNRNKLEIKSKDHKD